MNQIDNFHSNIKKELDSYTGEVNPTVSQKAAGGKAQVTTTQPVPVSTSAPVAASSKKRKQVAFSI